MKTTTVAKLVLASSLFPAGLASAALTFKTPVAFSGSFTENFDEIGTTGAATPPGWDVLSLSGTHDTFAYSASGLVTTTFLPWQNSTSINVGQGASALSLSDTLTVNTFTANTGVRTTFGYNFGSTVSPNVSTDRALGSSPTGTSATELQLGLTNSTGSPLNSFNLSYDIRRFTTTTNNNNAANTDPWIGEEELPGFSVFYSLDSGATWANVSALNPQNLVAGQLPTSGPAVPNTVGVTSIPSTAVSLSSPWNNGSTLLLRWFDDNAEAPSPDQNIGLDNVAVSVPEPASIGLMAIAGIAMLKRRARRI